VITLSVIIPFFDSQETLQAFLPKIVRKIYRPQSIEVILVDATGDENNSLICKECGVERVVSDVKGRAIQMNLGAAQASGNWFFFLHIDSIPPDRFDLLITEKNKIESGCFQLKFDLDHWFLRFFAGFTRFSWPIARGGDQGLFIQKEVFKATGGFENIPIMEDIDYCRRLMARNTFEILPEKILTSARKYREQGIYRLQFIFALITVLYWLGVKPNTLKRIYDKNIR